MASRLVPFFSRIVRFDTAQPAEIKIDLMGLGATAIEYGQVELYGYFSATGLIYTGSQSIRNLRVQKDPYSSVWSATSGPGVVLRCSGVDVLPTQIGVLSFQPGQSMVTLSLSYGGVLVNEGKQPMPRYLYVIAEPTSNALTATWELSGYLSVQVPDPEGSE